MAIMTALGGLLGGLGSTKAANTSTTANNFSSSGTSAPSFTPGQTALQGTLGSALNNEITNGPNLTPLMTSGTNAINQTYKGIGDRLNESLSSRGFGNSGASGSAALQTELGRAGAVGDLQSNLEGYALQQQQQALGQALGYSFAAPTMTTSGSGSSYGTSVAPHSVAAGVTSGIYQNLNNQMSSPSLAQLFNGYGDGPQTFTAPGYGG